jgi:hypothetical protein
MRFLMLQKKCVLRLVLSCTAISLAGCGLFPSPPSRPLLDRLTVDTSPGSGVSGAEVTRVVDGLLPVVVRSHGAIEFYRLDDVEGAVFVGRFIAGSPTRESRSVLAAFERDRIAEGKRIFLSLRDQLLAVHPRSSPLALALTVMSMNVPVGVEARFYLVSDAREWSPGVDMECHPPTTDQWSAHLHDAGLLPAGSLHGATVTFVGVRPLMSVPGNRCGASLPVMNQDRALWESAINNAAGRLVIARDSDDVPGTAVLFLFGGGLLWWRKRVVRERARENRKAVVYAPVPIIIELLGIRPGMSEDDPRHQERELRIHTLGSLIHELGVRLRAVGEELAEHVRWLYLALGTSTGLMTEGIAWTLIFRDAGVPVPERYLLGAMSGFFFLILVMIAAKHVEQTGQRRVLIVCISIISVIAIAATAVRVKNAMTSGGDLWEELALGILLLCAALGPAIASEYLLRPLRAVLPLVRLRRELMKQLREAIKERNKLVAARDHDAKLQAAWQWEAGMLHATYDGINPPPPETPTQFGNVMPIFPLTPTGIKGGMSWPGSGSSSTAPRS